MLYRCNVKKPPVNMLSIFYAIVNSDGKLLFERSSIGISELPQGAGFCWKHSDEEKEKKRQEITIEARKAFLFHPATVVIGVVHLCLGALF